MRNFTSVISGIKKTRKLFLLLTVILFSMPFSSYSTHIVGGELNYKCLGGNQYQIKLTVYRDCYTGVPPFDNPASVGIFDNNNVLVTTLQLPFPGKTTLQPTVAQANVCVKTPTNICVEVAVYVGTVTLPPRAGGYQLAYQRCCRNPTVDNIVNPGNQGATYYARIPDQAVACNSNPVFKNWPPIFVCANNQIIFDHSATDADGDVIVYSLCSPLDGGTSTNTMPSPPTAPPYNSITWKAPYSASNPLGGNTLTIDPNTGLMSGTPTTLGQYVVGVCADEYRNGVLISTTKRDFQFNVINCQPDIVAASVHATTNCATHTVAFTNNSTGATNFSWNFGDPSVLSDTSNVKNPTYNYPAAGTYTVSLIAYSSINSKCNDTLKSYVVTVTDCPPCTMTLGMSSVDATCGGTSGATGCVEVTYLSSCTAGQTFSITYAGSSASSSCGGGTATAGGGFPAPTTATLVVNGATLPPPTFPPQTYVQLAPVTQATCPRASSVTNSGGVITFKYNLWLGSPSTLGSATVTPSSGTSPYTYAWTPSGGTAATAGNLSAGTYSVTVTDATGCSRTSRVIINSTSSMTLSTSKTALTLCNSSNATATVTPANGVGPYTYLWSNGQTTATATGLTAGTYTVNVGDNGCSLSTTITIPPPVTLTVGTSKTNIKCNGNNGIATANPSGGSGSYTYSWSTSPVKTGASITGLTAGTYSVTVTDGNGCTGTASVNINDNSLTLTSTSTSPVCGGGTGGTATISATGGTIAYNYSWNSIPVQTTASATGLPGGDYIGTVIDGAGCSDTVMVSINEPSQLLPEPKNTSTINCAGVTTGSAYVDVSGGTGAFTYLWNPGAKTTQSITGLSAGTYTVTVTDSKGCTGTNAVSVTLPGPLSLAYFPSNVTGCNGGNNGSLTVNPTGGNPGYTYLWNTSPVQTTQSITGLTAGTYTVVVTDITGCKATLNTAVVTQPATISLSTGSTPVGCSSNNGVASVTATGGTGAYTYAWSPTGKTTDNITGLSTGTYSITVTDVNGCSNGTSVMVANASVPTVGISGAVASVNCTGSATGSATVTAAGGTGTITYSWSNGVTSTTGTATGLTAGTYIVTITDANGCTATQSVSITQPASALSSSIIGQGDVNCTGSATGTATVTGSGGTPSYTYNWSTGVTTSNTVTGLTAGTYTVLITDSKGCTKQQTVNITQPASALGLSILGQVDVKCTGAATGTAAVTGSGGTPAYTYVWSNGASNTTGTVSGLTAGTYTVTLADTKGCTKEQTISITQPASALSGVTASINATCGQSNGTASVTSSGGTGLCSYSWTPTAQTTTTAIGLSAGSYTVKITDANGCTANASVSVNNANGPTVGISGTVTNATCTGNATGSATVTAAGGTGKLTYSWNNGVTSTTGSASGLAAGTYICTVTDSSGCAQGQTVIITQPASAVNGTISQSNVGCTGSATGSATVSGSGGTPGYTYNWSTGVTTSNSITGLSAGTYSVIVTDTNSCTVQKTIIITEPAAVVGGVTSQSNAKCTGSATGSASVTGSGGTLNYTYVWSTGVTTSNAVTGLTAGTYSVTIKDGNGCTNQQTVTITQPTSALGTITSSVNAACNGSNGSASVTASGGTIGYIYSWSPNTATDSVATNLSAGTYTVLVTDANGCTSTATASVGNAAGPVAGIGSTVNVGCLGASTGSATITASGGTAPLTYSWNNGVTSTTNIASGLTAGTYIVIVKDANNCSLQQSVTITQPVTSISTSSSSIDAACGSSNGTAIVSASGGTFGYTYNWGSGVTTSNSLTGLSTGTYSVTVTDANSCTKTATIQVKGAPGPSISSAPTSPITCNGLKNGTATITVINGTLPYTYAWNPNVTASNTFNGLSAGTYTVIVSDSAFCKDTVSFTINEPLPITFTLSVSNASVCSGESLTLLTTTPSGGTPPFTFNWYPSGPVVSPLVPITYSVTVQDASGCISQFDTIRVTPIPSPIANFDTTSSGAFGMTFTFTDLSTGGTSWFWDFGDGKTSTSQNPSHIFSGAGTYTVTQIVKGLSNCADTITKVIYIEPNITFPNVFTPNNDGVNDEFWIPNTGFESFNLAIFDRWGLKLFEVESGEIRWDGRTRAGQLVPDGTYYYLLVAKLKTDPDKEPYEYNAKGFINLVRGGGK